MVGLGGRARVRAALLTRVTSGGALALAARLD